MSEPVRAQAMRLSAVATRNPLSESWWLALAKNGSSTLRAVIRFLGRSDDRGFAQFHSSTPFLTKIKLIVRMARTDLNEAKALLDEVHA